MRKPNVPPEVADNADAAVAPETLLTVQGVSRLLKVPVSWVYEYARGIGSDRLPAFKLGKYLRFRSSEIAKWLQQREA